MYQNRQVSEIDVLHVNMDIHAHNALTYTKDDITVRLAAIKEGHMVSRFHVGIWVIDTWKFPRVEQEIDDVEDRDNTCSN